MKIEQNDLENLKEIYYKYYKVKLTDVEAVELGARLISLFNIVAKPKPKLDSVKRKIKNGGRNG